MLYSGMQASDLRSYRLKRGLSQREMGIELARMTGRGSPFHWVSVSRWERERKRLPHWLGLALGAEAPEVPGEDPPVHPKNPGNPSTDALTERVSAESPEVQPDPWDRAEVPPAPVTEPLEPQLSPFAAALLSAFGR